MTETVQVQCDIVMAQTLVTTLGAGVLPTAVTINQGTAIGEGSLNGATPFMLTNLAADPNNTQTISVEQRRAPFLATGTVPDTASGFCNYPADGGAPTRITHVTGAKFETAPDAGPSDPMVPMAPSYFPLVYNTTNTTSRQRVRRQAADHRPLRLASEGHRRGAPRRRVRRQRQDLVLHADRPRAEPGLHEPDQRRLLGSTATTTGCPATVTGTNAELPSRPTARRPTTAGATRPSSSSRAPATSKTGQFLYMLDRNTNNIPGTATRDRRRRPALGHQPQRRRRDGGSSTSSPSGTPTTRGAGANDIKSISSTLEPDARTRRRPSPSQQTVGLTEPRRHHGRVPDGADGAAAGSPVTVLYVQKILDGDNTGSTALPAAQQCTRRPFSGKTNHDISNVRLATTTDGVHFTDLGIVNGLSDPTTVDYNRTRWVSPRGTLIDINGDGSALGPVLLGRQLPRRRLRRVPLHRLRRVDRHDELDRLQRHQQPDRVDQPDHDDQPGRRARR